LSQNRVVIEMGYPVGWDMMKLVEVFVAVIVELVAP
jgi:hypothetical protein